MQDMTSIAISIRFFDALDNLISCGETSFKGFADRAGVDRSNLYKAKRDHRPGILQLSLLSNLVEWYGVSADWLLTGRGTMLKSHRKVQETCKRNNTSL